MSMSEADVAALFTQAMIQRGYFDEVSDSEKCTVNESRSSNIVATYKNFTNLLKQKTGLKLNKELAKLRQDI